MTYRFQHCQAIVPRQEQFRRFGGDVAEWRCMAVLTKERIEILLDYELAANTAQIRGMTGWSMNSSCVSSYEDPSSAEHHGSLSVFQSATRSPRRPATTAA